MADEEQSTEQPTEQSLEQPTELAKPDASRLAQSGAHVRTAGAALLNWGRAVLIEGLCLAALWWIGLLILHVPLAAVWALIAGVMAIIPNIGGVIALIGPVLSVLFTGHDMDRLAFLLGLYAVIVVVDQLAIQPLVMKKVTRVPVWASLLVPIVLGILIPFWGVLLAPPLLAVLYAFRRPRKTN
jgi:predicted PurR-regulated permease PerM